MSVNNLLFSLNPILFFGYLHDYSSMVFIDASVCARNNTGKEIIV